MRSGARRGERQICPIPPPTLSSPHPTIRLAGRFSPRATSIPSGSHTTARDVQQFWAQRATGGRPGTRLAGRTTGRPASRSRRRMPTIRRCSTPTRTTAKPCAPSGRAARGRRTRTICGDFSSARPTRPPPLRRWRARATRQGLSPQFRLAMRTPAGTHTTGISSAPRRP